MENFFEVLRKCPLFQEIRDEDLLALLGCLQAKQVKFDKKSPIIIEGDRAEYIGIVLSGSVQAVRNDYFGNRNIVMCAEPSDLFGEAFACAEVAEIPVTIVANEPCEVLLISCHRIMHSCSNACGFHQQMIFNLMKNLARKNLHFHQKLEITSQRSTRNKLLVYLRQQEEKHGSRKFRIPFSRQELADYLEVDRSGLSAEISKLRNEGVLRCERSWFELL